jgi:hypothetical protein
MKQYSPAVVVTNRGSPFTRRRNGSRGMVKVPVLPVGVGSGGFGLLLAAIGVGAAFGPLLLARLVSNPHRPALVFGPLLVRGLVDLVLASSRSLG